MRWLLSFKRAFPSILRRARAIALDEKGAIVVEYVLLLAAGAVIAHTLIQFLTKYPEGFFIKYWKQLVRNIAGDMSSNSL